MLTAILRSLRTGVVTIRYPEDPARPPERFRGAPAVRPGSLLAELPPESICPSGAITREPGHYAIDVGRCLFCGRCAESLQGDAIELGRQVELASRQRKGLVVEVESDGGAARAVAQPQPPPSVEVAEQIRRTLGRSLALRHLDAGSCNACDWELTALLNPVYDIRRLGIDFVASPRHADGVIVTGPVTRNLETAVRRTYEAVPEPRIVIAVGACATSGGVVGRSYASAGGVAEALPVDVFIPGCPPRPEAIIFGILLAVGRVAVRGSSPAALFPAAQTEVKPSIVNRR
jgi:Ni,Fe-hydrogenase III small subunit/formate hydrogenlyase subunit 6/NADH:ubiquinone oxidoreductase subunit I